MKSNTEGSSVHAQTQASSPETFLTRHPALKYLGFSLLLTYHYVLWFQPDSFVDTALLSDRTTFAWLINLAGTILTLGITALIVGRKHHLSGQRWLMIVAPLLLTAGTLVLCYLPAEFENPFIYYGLSFVLGSLEALLLLLWGERYACIKANFSIMHIGAVFSLTIVVSMVIAWIFPKDLTPLFTACLPLLSAALLLYGAKNTAMVFPPLLPREGTRGAMRSTFIVCLISFIASMACYFLVAIIPWEALPFLDSSFMLGILVGAGLMLLLACIYTLSKGKLNIFKLYPWMIILVITSFALFLADEALYSASFLAALGVSSLFETVLIIYFGILTTKGYLSPVMAFSLSIISNRTGILVGNSLAIGFERVDWMPFAFVPEVALTFICLLAMVLIPLIRQEFTLLAITSAPLAANELDSICEQMNEEFKLSDREGEILRLLARGNTANGIATKLVISPHTVNTHIRHIYEKTQIHKRSDLLDYINMHRGDL